ncbi:Abi family protein [Rothia dentocariosa]|uniref:Abi family protein n=1 Tax=Rothia dentocariosa TaxID=2047 RepID=UPI003A8C0E85
MGEDIKEFKTYNEQIDILVRRGMDIEDRDEATFLLQQVSYYRLSGYCYPFREFKNSSRADTFFPGTRWRDVVDLYRFDSRLRTATFTALTPIELAIRAHLGHELGSLDPLIHLDPKKLGVTVDTPKEKKYNSWRKRYDRELESSREDFVKHHKQKYGGKLPVWAATEIMDWGSLTYLYEFSPRSVQDAISSRCGLNAPQLHSWLKALNIVRNICAHHGRLFNRVHTISPKLPAQGTHTDLDCINTDWKRTFGQLTLVQLLLDRLNVGNKKLLPTVVQSFPEVQIVPISHMGAPDNWQTASRLWSV